MRGDVIPDDNHVSRHCPQKSVIDGRVQPTAFMLRNNEASLSVNWLEILSCTNRAEEIATIRDIFLSKGYDLRPRAKLAILNVGTVRFKVLNERPDNRNLQFTHEPDALDPSHSGIYNLMPDNELIAELITQTIIETYPAPS